MSLDQTTDFVKHQTATRDAFLGGRLTLSQPRHGFRAGLDSVLLGAAAPAGTGRLLDLGAGVGTAGLVALSLGRAERADLLERDAATAALARDNVAGNGLEARARVIEADLTVADARRAAGWADNGYDGVIANPPFFAAGQGTLAPDLARADARHMETDALDLWGRCAAASARAGERRSSSIRRKG
ncbi:tRNA1(Val) (adenine(37)-N6)-methyltransferase [Devosia aurantiaca]|uniref:Methyltransferase n=1 Tax=Devosia aurantiaca TaxID=2714858 RepID=A0A6M1SSS8_9HYPH|nr:methyltransferase [Devosia aurantiaca]NGP17473.1 methyltransferase [Devosia aurantiaca]